MAYTIPRYTIFELTTSKGCDSSIEKHIEYTERYVASNKKDAEAACTILKSQFPDKTFVVEYTPDIIGLF